MRIAPTALIIVAGLLVAQPHAANAQNTEAGKCYELWKTADANRNGMIDTGETVAGGSLNMTRDVFLEQCLKSSGASLQQPPGKPSQAGIQDDFPKDLGKGDLTKGNNPFSEADARKRLEALGFKEVADLKLDANGIWRGTAISSGEREPVGLDAQGDVVSR